MQKILGFALVVSLAALLGCGDRQKSEADKLAEAARQSFGTAPEPVKTKFQELKSAIEASDWLKAKARLDELRQSQPPLSPEQQMAIAEQEQALMLKASTAAQNGDANALKLLQAVRSERRAR
jgi:hypothetical protein